MSPSLLTFFSIFKPVANIKFAGISKILPFKKYILTIICCGLAIGATAQSTKVFPVSGFVCTRGTSLRVALVMVINKQNKGVVFTDELGNFTIKATLGDTLEFSKGEFTTVQQRVAGPQDIVVFMQQVTHLAEVKVKGQTKQQEVNGVMDDYRKKGVYYGGKPPVLSAINSPLNALYSAFGKDSKDARHFAEISKKDLEAAQDNRKYNKELIKKVTALPDEEADKFMYTYKPLHEDLMKWSQYDVIAYIKRSFESYKKYGVKDLPKLN